MAIDWLVARQVHVQHARPVYYYIGSGSAASMWGRRDARHNVTLHHSIQVHYR